VLVGHVVGSTYIDSGTGGSGAAVGAGSIEWSVAVGHGGVTRRTCAVAKLTRQGMRTQTQRQRSAAQRGESGRGRGGGGARKLEIACKVTGPGCTGEAVGTDWRGVERARSG
jgi:hypothetical protein